jgi:hypothetical protein
MGRSCCTQVKNYKKNVYIFGQNSDTDSIVISHQRGLPPLLSGSFLGQMQLEYEKWEILEFCSGCFLNLGKEK